MKNQFIAIELDGNWRIWDRKNQRWCSESVDTYPQETLDKLNNQGFSVQVKDNKITHVRGVELPSGLVHANLEDGLHEITPKAMQSMSSAIYWAKQIRERSVEE